MKCRRQDQIRVHVYNPLDARFEKVSEVLSSVVEGLFEGLSDGGGDQVANDLWIEVIDLDVQLWEGGFDEGFEVGFED